jgi:lysophospholipase L1-like esterase
MARNRIGGLAVGGPSGWRIGIWIVVWVGLVSGFSATAAAASRPAPSGVTLTTPVDRGALYLALGDSVTFGYQEPTVVPAPNYLDATSFIGYPEQLGSELHLRVVNAACPGETSASLINASAQSLGCENAYRRAYPLHVRYTGAQLAYAISFLRRHRQVKLVSLMIGANDAFICQATTSDHCASPTEQRAVFDQVTHNVHRILSAIRNQAHYHGQLAIINYYSTNYSSASLSHGSLGLNQAMDGAAKPFDVEIADGYGDWRSASRHSAANPCAAGLLTQVGAGQCGVHPSYAGQALLAQALLKVIRLA